MIVKKNDDKSIEILVSALQNGEVVIIPTDTVYGFSGIVDEKKITDSKIRKIKGREENKPFIQNVYRCVSREKVESYLYKLTYNLIADVVNEKCAGAKLSEENKAFIAGFYKYGFVGIMLEWIDHGMKEDYQEIVRKISITLHGNIANAIHNFEQEKKI